MRLRHICLALFAASQTGAQVPQSAGTAPVPLSLGGIPLLSTTELQARINRVMPNEKEDRYLRIPWRTHIVDALRDAQAQKKPLFVWAMDGNPLGWC